MSHGRTDPVLAAWELPTQRAPESLTARGRLRAAVRWAVLAPSRHNAQPWRFVLRGEALELWADRSRALPAADPQDRELVIACGAALANLRLALGHLGDQPDVVTLPDPGQPDLLARVTLTGRGGSGPDDAALFAAIAQRRTNRAEYEPRDVPDDVLRALVREAEGAGTRLHVITQQAERWELGALVEEADRAQFADPDFRHELTAWLRADRDPAPDGVRGYGLGRSDPRSLVARLAVRRFDLGRTRGARDRSLVEEAPAAAVLGTAADDTAAWLQAGEGLQRMLLRARVASVWAAFHNQAVEVPAVRDRLARLAGLGFPQVVLRLGYGPAPQPEPRRSADDVLVEA